MVDPQRCPDARSPDDGTPCTWLRVKQKDKFSTENRQVFCAYFRGNTRDLKRSPRWAVEVGRKQRRGGRTNLKENTHKDNEPNFDKPIIDVELLAKGKGSKIAGYFLDTYGQTGQYPSIADAMNEFNVSRQTVNRALRTAGVSLPRGRRSAPRKN